MTDAAAFDQGDERAGAAAGEFREGETGVGLGGGRDGRGAGDINGVEGDIAQERMGSLPGDEVGTGLLAVRLEVEARQRQASAE
jgi:hypothetical protein